MSHVFENTRYSVLDLSPIVEGGTAADSYQNTVDLARRAEERGYERFWLAEHHNMPFIGSSATSVLIGHVAGATSSIRVGSGGIMLPNHAPLMIAEQFGTLETLYPNRIDLGLGRAPGTDQPTMQALRRSSKSDGHDFPQMLAELRQYLDSQLTPENPRIRAFPGQGLDIPIWLLGSSGFSAQLAGQLGLPFAFASHFSPDNTIPAMNLYRESFQPSHVLAEPYGMVCANVIAADTDDEADYLSTTMMQQFLNMVRGTEMKLQPPVENMDRIWNENEKFSIQRQLGSSIVGGPEKVKNGLHRFLQDTQADEIMINAQIYDAEARLRSYDIAADIMNGRI
ncbi:LLM class flavin-dependent oxidoreductase [Salibacterium halotolerans]|uniref:Luciferase family oxidoreductase, group 1 n=1 Tax=Salibacterium halotolerans TaxID=1884432 RepID=A0A1I5XHG9_9BACI|nr:LLM class flavin-dependent oxidoreductase [Salibacterium halotolerans]SFQ31380.1 luciferase family oxidoreductase, group 1 [Salibacterium halotolerans]